MPSLTRTSSATPSAASAPVGMSAQERPEDDLEPGQGEGAGDLLQSPWCRDIPPGPQCWLHPRNVRLYWPRALQSPHPPADHVPQTGRKLWQETLPPESRHRIKLVNKSILRKRQKSIINCTLTAPSTR